MSRRAMSALALAISLSLTPFSASAQETMGDDEVPILGTFTYPYFGSASDLPILGAVHGVRRVPGGTAVYFSVATRSDAAEGVTGNKAFRGRDSNKPGTPAYVDVSDPKSLVSYRPLISDEAGELVSTAHRMKAAPGQFMVVYAVLPELPQSTTIVDVHLEWGVTVTGVRVDDGPMLPEVDAEFVPLGEGWPALPDRSLISQADPAASTFSLQSRRSDLEQVTDTLSSPSDVSVTLASDFFFDPGKWELSAEGARKVEEIAADIKDQGATSVTVTGFTDTVPDKKLGNKKLSQRRAKTVADLIKTGASGIEIKVKGRGEADPVGSNSTDAGRAKNRRVTVDYGVDK